MADRIQLNHEGRLSTVEEQTRVIPSLITKQDSMMETLVDVHAMISNGLTVKIIKTVRRQVALWGGVLVAIVTILEVIFNRGGQ